MISEDIKKPPTFSLRPEEVKIFDAFLQNTNSSIPNSQDMIQVSFNKRQWQILCAISSTFLWIVSLLSLRNVGVQIIRKVLNISLDEKDSKKKETNIPGDNDPSISGAETNTDISTEEDNLCDNSIDPNCANSIFEPDVDIAEDEGQADKDEPSEPSLKPKVTRENHHGSRGPDDFANANVVSHDHESLKSGDSCPMDECNGKIYLFLRDGEPRTVITFDFQAPFQATIHKMNDLRCNSCLTLYKVPFSNELVLNGANEGRYLYTAKAALVVLHYGLGMPMYRLDHLQSIVGDRFPESTQFDIFENVANSLHVLFQSMIKFAANAFLFQGDDVSCRVQGLTPELRERRSDKSVTLREGIHTSILIATDNEGHLIPILKTGIIHFGELLDFVLQHRENNLPTPMVVCDGNKVNQSFITKCDFGGCWEHLREYFVKASAHFPTEALEFLQLIKNIFRIDRETHDMDAKARLNHLKVDALPLVVKIKEMIDEYLLEKTFLPKSTISVAMLYFKAQYSRLILPFKTEAIPIHNNISEWCTYLVVRLMANSKQYKTPAGAAIGDVLITLILSSYLSLINPYDYILHCLKNKDKLNKNPEDFFPWQLKDQVKPMPPHKQMNFWRPPPPIASGLDPFFSKESVA